MGLNKKEKIQSRTDRIVLNHFFGAEDIRRYISVEILTSIFNDNTLSLISEKVKFEFSETDV